MANKKKTPTLQSLDKNIEKLQEIAWGLAENVNSDLMSVKDQIFEQGLIMMETDCLKNNETMEDKHRYIAVLNQAKLFYDRQAKKQQVSV